MATIEQRLRALEAKRKVRVATASREERFIGDDGRPWMRYSDGGVSIELPCNGRDDPLDAIWNQVEAGEERPEGLTLGESEAWDTAVMKRIGDQVIKRIAAGELMSDDLTPQERDCWELVLAVREKF